MRIILTLILLLSLSCEEWKNRYAFHCNDGEGVELLSFPEECGDQKTLIKLVSSDLWFVKDDPSTLIELFQRLDPALLDITGNHSEKHLINYTLEYGRLDLFQLIKRKLAINHDYTNYFYNHATKLDPRYREIKNYGIEISFEKYSQGNLENPEVFVSTSRLKDQLINSLYKGENLFAVAKVLAYSKVLEDWKFKNELDFASTKEIPLFLDKNIKVKVSDYIDVNKEKSLIRAFLYDDSSLLPKTNCSYQYFEHYQKGVPLCAERVQISGAYIKKYERIPPDSSMIFLKKYVEAVRQKKTAKKEIYRIENYLKAKFKKGEFYSQNGTFIYFYFLPIKDLLIEEGFSESFLYQFGKRKIRKALRSKNKWGQGYEFYKELR